jgi:hypothetical protein
MHLHGYFFSQYNFLKLYPALDLEISWLRHWLLQLVRRNRGAGGEGLEAGDVGGPHQQQARCGAQGEQRR